MTLCGLNSGKFSCTEIFCELWDVMIDGFAVRLQVGK